MTGPIARAQLGDIDGLLRGLRPATVAKIRLAWIVRRDRQVCGDGKWVRVPESKVPLGKAWLTGKPMYHWEPRR